MNRISNVIIRGIEKLLLVLTILLVAVTFLQVVCRFVLKIPTSWSEETVRFCFVWIIFLGAAVAVRENTHLMLDMLTSHLPPMAQKILRILVLVIIFVCAAVLLYGGTDYCIRTWDKSMVNMPLPAWCPNISAPLSSILIMWFDLQRLVEELRSGRKGEK